MLFRTEQGGEYTGKPFVEAARSAGVTQSMGGTGAALDEAVSEAFNLASEWELLRHDHFNTLQQASCVATGIDEYDSHRRHSTNGMVSLRRL